MFGGLVLDYKSIAIPEGENNEKVNRQRIMFCNANDNALSIEYEICIGDRTLYSYRAPSKNNSVIAPLDFDVKYIKGLLAYYINVSCLVTIESAVNLIKSEYFGALCSAKVETEVVFDLSGIEDFIVPKMLDEKIQAMHGAYIYKNGIKSDYLELIVLLNDKYEKRDGRKYRMFASQILDLIR